MEGTNPLTMIEWLSPYIWPAHHNGSLSVPYWVFLVTDQVPPFPKWHSALISDMEGTKSSHHDRIAQPLYLTCSLEWLLDSPLPLGRDLDLENTKLVSKVFELYSRQRLRQYIIIHTIIIYIFSMWILNYHHLYLQCRNILNPLTT